MSPVELMFLLELKLCVRLDTSFTFFMLCRLDDSHKKVERVEGVSEKNKGSKKKGKKKDDWYTLMLTSLNSRDPECYLYYRCVF